MARLNQITRIKPKYTQLVKPPKGLQKYLWDHPGGEAPLEKVIIRVFTYASFVQLKEIYKQYPNECHDIINRYPGIKRGVKFWIKEWHGKND